MTPEKVNFRKCIVVLAGPPFMGKSTIGQELARRSNLHLLDTDDVRWQIFERPEKPHMLLDPRQDFQGLITLQAQHEQARDILLQDQPALIAATYRYSKAAEMVAWLAEKTNAPLRFFLLHAPDEEVRKRVKLRKETAPSMSKSFEDYLHAKEHFVQPTGINVFHIDTFLPLETNIQQIVNELGELQI